MDTGHVTDIRYADVIDLVRSRPAACGVSTIVAIDGPSGAGKSALADRLVTSLDAQLVRLDDLYRGCHAWRGASHIVPAAAEVGEPHPLRIETGDEASSER